MAKRRRHSRDGNTQHAEPWRAATRSFSSASSADECRLSDIGPAAWIVALVLATLIIAVYGPAVDTPFIFDDLGAITMNDSIFQLWPLLGTPGPLNPPPELPTSGRPLVNLSLAINYYFGGANPTGFHIVNLAFHLGAAMFVWAIVRRTLSLPRMRNEINRTASWLALAIAALWALHPLQTEAVIYITQRTELMMGLFYLATLYCGLRYWTERDANSRRIIWLMLAILSCLAGMTSKEVMVSAPLIVLLFDRTFMAESLTDALRRSWPLYIGLASTWIVLFALNMSAPHRDAAGFSLGVSAYEWWLTQSKVFWMYMKLFIWPWPLLIHYHFPYLTTLAEAWPYVVALFLTGVATLVLLWRNTPLGFLATWVFAILSPTFLIPIVTEMAAERRMYLALVPLVVIAVMGTYRAANWLSESSQSPAHPSPDSRTPLRRIVVACTFLALLYGVIDSRRLAAYDDEMILWSEVAKLQPADYMAPQSIGSFLAKRGEDAAAIEQFRKAVRLNRDASAAHYSLGELLSRQGAHDEAVVHFAEAVRILPKNPVLRNNLAFALYRAGRYAESIDTFRAAIALDPQNWAAHKNLGAALQKANQAQESIEAFQAALRLNPQAIEIYRNLAESYVLLNDQPTAMLMLRRGQELALAAGNTELANKFSMAIQAHE